MMEIPLNNPPKIIKIVLDKAEKRRILPVQYKNSASIGVDIETGGHVFQLHLTNSRAMADPQWIGRTPGSWANGDVYLGFNISRVFTLVKPKIAEEPAW